MLRVKSNKKSPKKLVCTPWEDNWYGDFGSDTCVFQVFSHTAFYNTLTTWRILADIIKITPWFSWSLSTWAASSWSLGVRGRTSRCGWRPSRFSSTAASLSTRQFCRQTRKTPVAYFMLTCIFDLSNNFWLMDLCHDFRRRFLTESFFLLLHVENSKSKYSLAPLKP